MFKANLNDSNRFTINRETSNVSKKVNENKHALKKRHCFFPLSTKITSRSKQRCVCVLYFSETWPRRRRTEGLVLTPITFREKLRVAPRVLFPILRYLQGAINKLFLGCRVWKEPNAKSERSPQMKSLLKVRSLAYFLTMQRFKIILRSITREPRTLHTPSQHEKFTPLFYEWSTEIVPLLYSIL